MKLLIIIILHKIQKNFNSKLLTKIFTKTNVLQTQYTLQKNSQIASKFLCGPFSDATIVGENGEKPTQKWQWMQNGRTYGFNVFF